MRQENSRRAAKNLSRSKNVHQVRKVKNASRIRRFLIGDSGIRARDLRGAKATLFQLSYVPERTVPPEGFEPSTTASKAVILSIILQGPRPLVKYQREVFIILLEKLKKINF